MMSHAGRDPIYWATVAIAEQDFDGAGDLFHQAAEMGFLVFTRSLDEASILTIAVDPRCQGRGLGGLLLDAAQRIGSSGGLAPPRSASAAHRLLPRCRHHIARKRSR